MIWDQKLGHRVKSMKNQCEDDIGHNFHQIFMKFGQNVYLDEIWVGIVYGSSGVKN